MQVIFATLLIACLCNAVRLTSGNDLPKIRLDAEGNFVDTDGMKRIFHGLNFIQKEASGSPLNKLNQSTLADYKEFGFNVIRIGVLWSRVMPEEESQDEGYLTEIQQNIESCAKNDIYVILQMHQEGLCSLFRSNDGTPLWLAKKLTQNLGEKAYPWPLDKIPTEWYENYKTYASAECAEQLYTDWETATKAWSDFWSLIAERFGSMSNILGFELINDPPPANFYKSSERILPSIVGEQFLLNIYDRLVDSIREVDEATLIFYAPLNWGQYEKPNVIGRHFGFSRAPGFKPEYEVMPQTVLSYRYFCWLLRKKDKHQPMNWIEKETCDEWLMPEIFQKSAESVHLTRSGRFLTAFGLCAPDGLSESTNTVECERIMEMADAEHQSWTYADGELHDEEGSRIWSQVRSFSRTYPQKITGTGITYLFNPRTRHFNLTFTIAPLSKQSVEFIQLAEIKVPTSIHYKHGVNVQLQPPELEWNLAETVLQLFIPPGVTINKYTTVELSLTPHVHQLEEKPF